MRIWGTFRRLTRLCRAYRADRSGQFALMFALSVMVVLSGIGLTVDFHNYTRDHQKAQNVLDASVMAAARAYQLEANARTARQHGVSVFVQQCETFGCNTKIPPAINIVENTNSTGFTVTGAYNHRVDTMIMDYVSAKPMKFDVDSEVSFQEATGYNDIYFVLDWSASLGIAASPAEQQALMDLTKPSISGMAAAADGCAFACHFDEGFIQPTIDGSVVTTYEFARANGISLREDVIAQKMSDIIDIIFDQNDPMMRIGAYAISDRLEEVKPVTNQPFTLSGELSSVSMAKYGTRFDVAMPDLTFELGQSGDGTGPNDTKKFIVLATDGLNNNYGGGILTSEFRTRYCDGLKNNGVTIAVLHLPYPDLGTQAWYRWFAEPHLPNTQTALQSCADDGLYFQAESPQEIADALLSISNKISTQAPQELAFAK